MKISFTAVFAYGLAGSASVFASNWNESDNDKTFKLDEIRNRLAMRDLMRGGTCGPENSFAHAFGVVEECLDTASFADGLDNYGCWCGHTKGLSSLLGTPADDLDALCLRLAKCQRCTGCDAPTAFCASVVYSSASCGITCDSEENTTCEQNHCECNKKFAEEASKLINLRSTSLESSAFHNIITPTDPTCETRTATSNNCDNLPFTPRELLHDSYYMADWGVYDAAGYPHSGFTFAEIIAQTIYSSATSARAACDAEPDCIGIVMHVELNAGTAIAREKFLDGSPEIFGAQALKRVGANLVGGVSATLFDSVQFFKEQVWDEHNIEKYFDGYSSPWLIEV